MNSFQIFPIIVLLTIVVLNFLIVRYLIRRAIKKHILPQLKTKGLTYLDYKWCGLFSHGNFDDETAWSFIAIKGDPRLSIYVDIYYEDAGNKKTITIRINTIFYFIRKVYYSDNSFNL